MADPNAPLVPADLRKMLQHELNPFERLTDMLSGHDDRADMQIMLLYNILVALTGLPPAGPEQEFPTQMGVQVPLSVRSVDLMKNIEALTTAEIKPQRMADCRKALRTLVMVNNTFNQSVVASIIGNVSNDSSSAFEIESFEIPSGSRRAFGLKYEQWFPWIGVTVTPNTAPTSGSVNAVAILLGQGNQ